MWVGGLACIVFGVIALVTVVSLAGLPRSEVALAAIAVQDLTEPPPTSASRTSCDEFGDSDLRSAGEGVWFQANCTSTPSSDIGSTKECNRTSLDPTKLVLVTPGLYVYRHTEASVAYLWFASSDTCFNLVSDRVVTVVCSDQTVSFSWSTDACAAHGGVLVTVNGR